MDVSAPFAALIMNGFIRPSQFDNPAPLADRGGDNAGMKANRHHFPGIEPSRQLTSEENIAEFGTAISAHHRPIARAGKIVDVDAVTAMRLRRDGYDARRR